MKKVLIIAYYFPPMGGSGVQRPFQLAKYLREFGWEPFVVTQSGGAYSSYDEMMQKELESLAIPVYRISPIGWTPQRLSVFVGRSRSRSQTGSDDVPQIRPGVMRSKLLSWITRWFFIPDNKTSWIPAAVQKAGEILKEHSIDLIFATAPPFSSFLASCTISKQYEIPQVMDFRDSWVDNQYHRPPTRWHKKQIRRMEQQAVASASALVAINPHTAAGLRSRMPETSSLRLEVLPNGFDPDHFGQDKFGPNDLGPNDLGPNNLAPDNFDPHPSEKNRNNSSQKRWTLIHAGQWFSSSPHQRQKEIRLFLRALDRMIAQYPETASRTEMIFIGHTEPLITTWLKKRTGTSNAINITQTGYRPHAETLGLMREADALLLTLSSPNEFRGVTPGKMFEYFGARKPIYALVPRGETSRYLSDYGGAVLEHSFTDSAIAHSLAEFLHNGHSGALPPVNLPFVGQFDRRKQAQQLANLFDDVVSNS